MVGMVESWANLSVIVSSARGAIIGETLNSVIASCNAGGAGLFGYAAEDVIGRSLSILTANPRFHADFSALVERIRRGDGWFPPFEDEFKCKDGAVLLVSVVLSPVFDGSERLIGLSRLVRVPGASTPEAGRCGPNRPRQGLERELPYLSWCSGAGQMAAVLAHELNHSATAIVSYLNSARWLLRTGENSDLSVLTTTIDRAVDQAIRAAQIIRHLWPFVPQGNQRQSASIGATIREASTLVLIEARQTGVVVDCQLGSDAAA